MAQLDHEIDAIIETLTIVKFAQKDPVTRDRLMTLAFRALQVQGDLSAAVARSLSRHMKASGSNGTPPSTQYSSAPSAN